MDVFKTIGIVVRAIAAFVGGLWVGLNPLFQALIVLMALDIVTGMLSGYVAKQLNSDVSLRGVTKKALILLVVAGASVVAPHVGELPLAEVVAAFYIAHEGLSIIENLGEAGLPVPQVLRDALAKLNGVQNGGDKS